MRKSLKKGFGFGLTSGIITTLGLLIGLYASTESKMVIIGGVIIIAIADAFSDAFGIHISEEACKVGNRHDGVWEATFATFSSKFFFALTFIIPLILFELFTAVIVSIVWGMFLLGLMSFVIAKEHKVKPWKVIGEHLLIASTVIALTYYVGKSINLIF
ncbi:hypothetical protein ACFLZZ_03480 [Nanoarchaeota archaeon]